MEHTWASGALELIRHADTHINLNTAFDGRIAFISVDNAVETSIRVFLSLPLSKSGIHVSKRELAEVENSFPALLTLLWNRAGDRLVGLDEGDIEHYHRIRNKLYHDGTGLSVDQQYLRAYRQIAAVLLKHLFKVSLPDETPSATLERLVTLWTEVDERVTAKAQAAGVEPGHTFFWEEAMQAGVISSEELSRLTELRLIRNSELHSTTLDKKRVGYAVALAEHLLSTLQSETMA